MHRCAVSVYRLLVLFPCLLAAVATARAATVTVSGQVGLEQDGRLLPLRDVAVSDGRRIVRTGADGRYVLETTPGRPVFVVKPSGHAFPAGADGLPRFWAAAPQGGDEARIDFSLRRVAPRAQTEVLLFADTQVGNEREIGYYRRSVVEPLGRPRAALGVTLGDMVNDQPGLYPALNAVTASLGVPWFHVPGNHDMDPGAVEDSEALRQWSAVYGPDTYAVEEGAAAFVFMDDVVLKPGGGYIGGLREDQFQFLEQYLAGLPPQRLLVLGVHIPLFDAAGRQTFRADDRRRLFALLRRHPKVLVLSAHSHEQRHYWHGADDGWDGGAPLHEFNLGAVCGSFWSGLDDAAGVPLATMADGTPRGHGLLQVRADGSYRLQYRPSVRLAQEDPSFTAGMAVHAPRVLRRGAYPAWGVYANVFMGDAETRVEFRVDGGPWQAMRRVERADPRLLLENVADDLADGLRSLDRSPEASASPHLWRGALPTRLAAGVHEVQVRAVDRWGGEVVAATRYRLEEARP